MTTDTPRTDEQIWTTEYHHEFCDVVDVEFAQQLERELAASKAEVERINASIKVKISKRPYQYECGDGCCTEWGETWYVDGEEIASGPCEDNLLQRILERLGFDAEIVNENEDGDEVCSL
jgi:hypothetical protein